MKNRLAIISLIAAFLFGLLLFCSTPAMAGDLTLITPAEFSATLDQAKINYEKPDDQTWLMEFEGQNFDPPVQVRYDENFCYIITRVLVVPDKVDAEFYLFLLNLNYELPQAKVMVDEERNLLLSFEVPLSILTAKEFTDDVMTLPNLADKLYPDLAKRAGVTAGAGEGK